MGSNSIGGLRILALCGILLGPASVTPAATSTQRVFIFSDAVTTAANAHVTYYSPIPSFPVPVPDVNGAAWSASTYEPGGGWAGIQCVNIPQINVAALSVPWTRTVNCGIGTASPTTADWIAPVRATPAACTGGPGPTVHGDEWYMRREFTLPGPVVSATLWVAVDNMSDLWVDGIALPPLAASGYYEVDIDTYNVTALLGKGSSHVLAFRVYNQDQCSWTGVVYTLDATVLIVSPDPPVLPECGKVRIVGGVRGYLDPKRGEQATIQVRVCEAGTIRVRIFSEAGTLVHEENRSSNATGMDVFQWNLVVDGGRTVPPGIYAVRVEGPGVRFSGRLAVMR